MIPIPAIPSGDAAYTAKSQALRARLASQIPPSLRLPAHVLSSLPLDVTSIPASCGLLTRSELEITDQDATELLARLREGRVSAVEVVTAFGKRAAVAEQLVGCLVDFFLDEGLERARELDEYYKREGKVVGPLHGLPISIKEQIRVKGRIASGGFLANVEMVSNEDAHMVSILRSLGAVFYVKTNQPQSINHLETVSLYGRTLNPYNTNLTCGGSSGGEAALIALKGSCLGVGNDGGGSIRNPCANCGVYGLKPTANRMPKSGYLHYHVVNDGSTASTGPMARSARDIALFMDTVLSAQPSVKDPLLVPVPWSVPTTFERKPRIGVMMNDGVVTPQPAMLRALREIKAKLVASGQVEVVDFEPYQHGPGYDIVREIYFEDGGQTVRRLLKEGGEDILPLTEWVISPPHTKDHTAAESWALRARRDKYRQEYSDYWNASGCDVVLCPPNPGTANPHDTARYWGYTAVWNLLDYPGMVFPTCTKLDPTVDAAYESSISQSEADAYYRSVYDCEYMAGAPVSLQLVARRFNDGLLFAIQQLIEKIVTVS